MGAQSSAGQASLVRVETKTGSRGKYKAEPATGGGGEGQGALVQPARKLLQQVICTSAHPPAILRGKNCPGCYELEIALSYELLFAVVGCDCHTHRVPLHTKKTQ